MSNPRVFHLTDQTFEEHTGSGVTLVDFWAQWCGPCLALAPAIDKLADRYAGKVKVSKVDVDAHPELAARFGIRGIPTVILFKDGRPVQIITGNDPGRIEQLVQQHAH